MTFVLTTPLYYVNDKPHLGSTYTTLACDAIARYRRLVGEQVIFVTGVDEHGQKIQRTAESQSKSPQDHCNIVTKQYRELWDYCDISNDKFVRTTSSIHNLVVNQFFNRVEASEDIYIGHQKGWYCVGCEEFKEAANSESTPTCDTHLKPLEWRDEENLFFRLSKYQTAIEKLVDKDDFIFPINRRNEVRNFVNNGLRDFSISRINVSWGISVPRYNGHTFYVWFDALLGYISSLYSSDNDIDLADINKKGWPASLHIVGKDILRFHAVYWPAMLMSAGLDVPRQIFAHGFLTREGNKMGKSTGNVIDPKRLISNYGIDQVRWYLLRDFQFGQDGDFQQRRFVDLINNDLANSIGNLLNRSSSMSRKWFSNSTPEVQAIPESVLSVKSIDVINKCKINMNLLHFSTVAESILSLSKEANTYLNGKAPWKLIKDSKNQDEVRIVIYNVLETTRIIGILLMPILPNLSSKILSQLSIKSSQCNWKDHLTWGLLKQGELLPESQPVISKIELTD